LRETADLSPFSSKVRAQRTLGGTVAPAEHRMAIEGDADVPSVVAAAVALETTDVTLHRVW